MTSCSRRIMSRSVWRMGRYRAFMAIKSSKVEGCNSRRYFCIPADSNWNVPIVQYNVKGEPVETATYTPLSFLKKYGDEKLIDNYVMLMNDPSREYYKCYEID